jgi:hypothetical protein
MSHKHKQGGTKEGKEAEKGEPSWSQLVEGIVRPPRAQEALLLSEVRDWKDGNGQELV